MLLNAAWAYLEAAPLSTPVLFSICKMNTKPTYAQDFVVAT